MAPEKEVIEGSSPKKPMKQAIAKEEIIGSSPRKPLKQRAMKEEIAGSTVKKPYFRKNKDEADRNMNSTDIGGTSVGSLRRNTKKEILNSKEGARDPLNPSYKLAGGEIQNSKFEKKNTQFENKTERIKMTTT
jgi:hypothetical protein